MISNEVLRSLASEIQLFNDIEQKETFSNLEQLYQDLVAIDFRVKRSLFDEIFGN